MPDLSLLTQQNERRWKAMKVNADVETELNSVARRLIDPKAQARYARVEGLTGVPRNVVAVIHEREASQNWATQLGQGDPLNRVSTHVPKGRGPFATWEDGAVDALKKCPPYAATWHDWSAGGTLTLLEQYNGLGYFYRGRPSPYNWAGSDQYVSGKFVSDGIYDPAAIDKQLGCAIVLHRMQDLQAAAKPVVPPPAPAANWFMSLISVFLSIFKRKP